MISEETNPLQGFLAETVGSFLQNFFKAVRKEFKLHLLFFTLLLGEASSLFLLLLIEPISIAVALVGALFLFTLFSYFSLRVYFASEKRSRFQEIQKDFLTLLKGAYGGEGSTLEERKFVTLAILQAAEQLEGKEYQIFPSRWRWFEGFLSTYFWHDILTIRESLLKAVIEEEIEMIKLYPLDPELHVALANGYTQLGELYKKERRGGEKFQKILQKKFSQATEKALVEFKILRQYDPKDPWILFQLAYTFGDLGRKIDELTAYEEASRLRPHDLDVLQKLGTLYFQSDRALEGLEIFDKLRKVDRDRADALISHYS
jgi:tetratricopeptide (TPR) repeat protein